jgi:2,3-dihydro-2,3-dihydroxybenzoate dehydrogenase
MPQTAVIVGAAQGIGEAIARRLAADGDRDGEVVLADLQFGAVEKLSDELTRLGYRSRPVHVDITRPESVAALVEVTPDATRVAIAAGTFQATPSLEVTGQDFSRVLEVNLIGVYEVARAYAQSMIKQAGGAICAVGSIAARMPRMRQAAYCASKAGMRQALRVLGLEVRPLGVRINFVAPGPTVTPMMDRLANDHPGVELWRGDLDTARPRVLDQRLGQPHDIAAATAFLLSDESSHVSLHDLYVDGGESLGI